MARKTTTILLATLPLLSSLAALATLILIVTAGLNKSSALQRDLYFFRADASTFRNNITTADNDIIPGTDIDDKILDRLKDAVVKDSLRDVYQVYLWGYCAGDVNEGESENEEKQFTITQCSTPEPAFAFDPVEIWGLENNVSDTAAATLDEAAQKLLPEAVTKGLDVYNTVSKAVFIAYIVAVGTTGLTCLLGLLVLASSVLSSSSSYSSMTSNSPPSNSYSYSPHSSRAPRVSWASRLASLATAITFPISIVSFFSTLAASLTATVLFAVLVEAVKNGLEPYGISANLGRQMLIVMWLAVCLNGMATVGWGVARCCCAKRRRRADGMEKGAAFKHDGFEFHDEKKKPGLVKRGVRGLFEKMRKDKKTNGFNVNNVRFDMVGSNYDGYNHYHTDSRSHSNDNVENSRRLAGDNDDDVAMYDSNSSIYSMYDDLSHHRTSAPVGTGAEARAGTRAEAGIGAGAGAGDGPAYDADAGNGIVAVAKPYAYAPYKGRRASDDDTNALLDPTFTVCDMSVANRDREFAAGAGAGAGAVVATTTSFLSGFSSRKNGEKQTREGSNGLDNGEAGGDRAVGYERVESPYDGNAASTTERGRAFSFKSMMGV